MADDKNDGNDGRGEEDGNSVLPFPDQRTRTARRQQDVSDEYLRMTLQTILRRLDNLEDGRQLRDIERRLLNLEKDATLTGTQVTRWKGQLGLVTFAFTAGAGGLFTVLKLMGKL